MIHIWVGDKKPSPQAIKEVIFKVWKNTKCTEITISPNKTVCNSCKTTIDGFHDNCPRCNSNDVFWIARITGYQVRIDKFNSSKLAELFDRNNHDMDNGDGLLTFLNDDISDDDSITIYSLPNCPNCKKIKKYCDENHITFNDINIEVNHKAKARLIVECLEQFPIVKLGHSFIEYNINNDVSFKNQIKEYSKCLNQ
jgi:glutaredoxin/RNA polymerase subunit RPABC4/transcription elongation factor Spt4